MLVKPKYVNYSQSNQNYIPADGVITGINMTTPLGLHGEKLTAYAPAFSEGEISASGSTTAVVSNSSLISNSSRVLIAMHASVTDASSSDAVSIIVIGSNGYGWDLRLEDNSVGAVTVRQRGYWSGGSGTTVFTSVSTKRASAHYVVDLDMASSVFTVYRNGVCFGSSSITSVDPSTSTAPHTYYSSVTGLCRLMFSAAINPQKFHLSPRELSENVYQALTPRSAGFLSTAAPTGNKFTSFPAGYTTPTDPLSQSTPPYSAFNHEAPIRPSVLDSTTDNGLISAKYIDGLKFCVDYRISSRNLANGKGFISTTDSRIAGGCRVLTRVNQSTDIYESAGFTGDFTLIVVGTIDEDYGTNTNLIGIYNGAENNYRISISPSNDAIGISTLPLGGTGEGVTISGSGNISRLQAFAGKLEGTTISGYLNGVKVGSATQTVSDWSDSTKIGVAGGTFMGAVDSRVRFGALWSKALSDEEIASICANPDFILNPFKKHINFPGPRPFVKTSRVSTTERTHRAESVSIPQDNAVTFTSANEINYAGFIGGSKTIRIGQWFIDAVTDGSVAVAHESIIGRRVDAYASIYAAINHIATNSYTYIVYGVSINDAAPSALAVVFDGTPGSPSREYSMSLQSTGHIYSDFGLTTNVTTSNRVHKNIPFVAASRYDGSTLSSWLNGQYVSTALTTTDPLFADSTLSFGHGTNDYEDEGSFVVMYYGILIHGAVPKEMLQAIGSDGWKLFNTNALSSIRHSVVTTDSGIIVPPYLSEPGILNLTSTTGTPKVRVDY